MGPPGRLAGIFLVEVPVPERFRVRHGAVEHHRRLRHGPVGRVHGDAEEVEPSLEVCAVEPLVAVEEALQQEVEAVDVAERVLPVRQPPECPGVVRLADEPQPPDERAVGVLLVVNEHGPPLYVAGVGGDRPRHARLAAAAGSTAERPAPSVAAAMQSLFLENPGLAPPRADRSSSAPGTG